METTASIIVMSHLSDVQYMNENDKINERINERLNFIKFIIHHTNGDLNKLIHPDKLWKEFKRDFS